MSGDGKPRPDIEQVAGWLAGCHGTVKDLEPLAGGFWSSAYAYRVGAEAFVLRLSDLAEGFAADAAAAEFAGPELPIPEILETGRALGTHYAISRRHWGHFIETVDVGLADSVGAALAQLLAALRSVRAENGRVNWFDESAADVTWKDWLRAGLRDDPGSRSAGWRVKLAEDRSLETLFEACRSRIEELLPNCPERRDLLHGDLLHQNVLVDESATSVTGVFSWKCSARGDFLFDVAWCTFWSPWHPVIAAADVWARTVTAPDLSAADLEDAALRHHCYELQIAASHFSWYLSTGDQQGFADLAKATRQTLARGPQEI